MTQARDTSALPLIPHEDLLPQRLHRWERERADEVYMSQPMGQGDIKTWTWAQAAGESRRLASWLLKQGWPAGSRIAILSKNSAYWLLTDFAIWMAGYVSVPLYPTLSAESVRQILEHSDAKAIVIGKLDAWPAMRDGLSAGIVRIVTPLSPAEAQSDGVQWESIQRDSAPLAQPVIREAGELATIIYTSGTTGTPKGVMHSFGSIALAARTMSIEFSMTRHDRMLSYLPLAHVAERIGVEANSVYVGMQVYFAESLDTFVDDIRRARPTIFFSVPRLWVKFQQGIYSHIPRQRLDWLLKIPLLNRALKKKLLQQLGLQHVRYAATGAAPLPGEVTAWYRALGLELLEVYGMTENAGLSHACRPGAMRVGYVGSPWPHVECRLSAIGEVEMRAPWLMQGYFRETGKTAEVMTADGFLRTGDLGDIDNAGRLRITGRAKEQFKTSKGKYVSPAPIENKLGTHEDIEAVCVAGADFPKAFGLVILSPPAATRIRDVTQRQLLEDSLQAHLLQVNASLDPHEQLAFIAVIPEQWTVDNGMITPTMKIKRAAIESTYGPHFKSWNERKQTIIWHR